MLLLMFQLGDDLFSIDAKLVVEIIPRVDLKQVQGAPSSVAGLFNYRGRIIPVVDLCRLVGDRPSADRLSTRIIIVNRSQSGDDDDLLGLMAEKVTEAVQRDDVQHSSSGIRLDVAFDLGEVMSTDSGMVKSLQLDRIPTGEIDLEELRRLGSEDGLDTD